MLASAAASLAALDPSAILVNCASPRAFIRSIAILAEARESTGVAWEFGGYPNGGEPDPILGYHHLEPVEIGDFVPIVAGALSEGARVIGSCCGTTPAYTAALRSAIDEFGSTR
jgi:S-methylmethionine-dependent homocysteine/selenocysteine methylase